jgi:two-component system cell cycle response regulator
LNNLQEKHSVKILIAEDDAVLLDALETKLAKWGYEVVATQNGDEAWQAVQAEDGPRIAILDWMMPGMDGLEVCRKIRESIKEPYIYIILLTALQGEEDLVSGMKAGADDYITKPFKSNELEVRLCAGIRVIELQDELITAREILREKATHDTLTGLWNHEEILRVLEKELARSKREGTCVGVIMLDLDHFKNVNDTLGHMAGDVVLRAIAQRSLALMRPYDTIGRFGGEEFLIIAPGCDEICIKRVAERLRKSIEQNSIDAQEGTIAITASFGVAVSSKEREKDAGSLVRGRGPLSRKRKGTQPRGEGLG